VRRHCATEKEKLVGLEKTHVVMAALCSGKVLFAYLDEYPFVGVVAALIHIIHATEIVAT
jgi:hypothetical protein